MKTLTVKLPDSLFDEIAATARFRGVAKSEIVRERLSQPNGQNASLWARMEDLVLEDDSLPRDLSSNKKHLMGYGKNRSDR